MIDAKNAVEMILGFMMNTVAWIAHSEQIWFGLAGTYMRVLRPMYGLPDLRGPFIFLTLLYVGLRLADWLEQREEIEETDLA
jgi:hypothetical protein